MKDGLFEVGDVVVVNQDLKDASITYNKVGRGNHKVTEVYRTSGGTFVKVDGVSYFTWRFKLARGNENDIEAQTFV